MPIRLFEVAQSDGGRCRFVGWLFVPVGQQGFHQLPLLGRPSDLVAVEVPGRGKQPRLALPGVEALDEAAVHQRLEENFLRQVLSAALVAAELRTEMFQLIPEFLIHLIPHGVSPPPFCIVPGSVYKTNGKLKVFLPF